MPEPMVGFNFTLYDYLDDETQEIVSKKCLEMLGTCAYLISPISLSLLFSPSPLHPLPLPLFLSLPSFCNLFKIIEPFVQEKARLMTENRMITLRLLQQKVVTILRGEKAGEREERGGKGVRESGG
jgi:hypothetical protein